MLYLNPTTSINFFGNWYADPVLYPVMLEVGGADVLVVGGGRVGAAKAAGLAACGAVVTVVAPAVTPEARAAATVVEERAFVAGDVAGRRLVVTATGVREVDSAVFAAATAAGIWVNSADDPDRCTFVLPAVLRRGPVIVSVSTSGASPALAKHLRDRIGEVVGPEVGAAAADLAARRAAIKAAGGSTEDHDWAPDLQDALRRAAEAGAAGPGR
jgi:siroheme synthase-like protein